MGCYAAYSAVSYELSFIMLVFSVKGRAEAAVHALRKFIGNEIDSHDPNVIVKLFFTECIQLCSTGPCFTDMLGSHGRDC